MRWCLYFILQVGVLMVGYSQSHRLRVQHFTMEDGLPNSFVHQIIQDREGFMWFATNYGYGRFDGAKMVGYNQSIFGKDKELPDNAARSMVQDVKDRIWIAYFNNSANEIDKVLEILDPVKNTVVSFDQLFATTAPFKMRQITLIQGDAAHGVWILTTTGVLYRYDGAFHKIGSLPASIFNSEYIFFYYTAAGSKAFWLYLPNQQLLCEVSIAGQISILSLTKSISSIWVDQHNVLWLTSGRFAKYDLEHQLDVAALASTYIPELWYKAIQKPLRQRLLPDEKAWVFPNNSQDRYSGIDKQDRLWFIKGATVYVFDKEGKLLAYATLPDTPANYTGVLGIYFDQSDNLWINTANGVYLSSLHSSLFTNYMTGKGIQDIRGIAVDRHNHIYVNQSKLYKIDKGENIVAHYFGIGCIRDGDILWSGMYAYAPQISKYHIETQKNEFICADPRQFPESSYIATVYKSKKTGRIWLGGDQFLGYVSIAQDSIEAFTAYNAFPQLRTNSTQFFYENAEGLWLATDNGLFLLDEQKGIVAHFDHFPYQNLVHLHEDKEGIFWLATRGGGLLRWNRATNDVQRFTQKTGLSNDVIYAVYEDEDGYLWLPSNYGLMRFNKRTHEVRNYLPKDGIPHQEFNYTSHTRTPDGRFFFGGLGGVTSFHPKDFLQRDALNAPLRMISCKKLNTKDGNLYDCTSDLLMNGKIILKPSESSLILELALLNYELPEKNQYAYRIEGLQKDWNYVTSSSLWIGQLPYGHYTIHIKAQDANKHWSKEQIHIPIWVKTPFYLQTWFLILTSVLFTGFVISIIRWRIARLEKNQQQLQLEVARQTLQIRQQSEKLQALDEQKSRFFLNIAHELRTPLTLIISPIDMTLERESITPKMDALLRSIRKNAQHLLRLVESILDISQLEEKQLKLTEQPVHLHQTVLNIFSMYESYAKLHGIDYRLHYQAEEGLALLLDRPKFEKILHNLLSNAVKFTPTGGLVALEIQETESEISIQVKDTGVGIPAQDLPYIFDRYFQAESTGPARGGIGMGLHIAKEYAQLMQGNLTVESTLEKGSVFYFTFPKKEVTGLVLNNQDRPNEVILDAPAKNTKRKLQTVLIVEDNVEMQELLRQIIAPSYHVLQAANGKKALEMLEKQEVHAVITDIMMPQMDGFELVDKIKASDQWKHLPIVVITARANEAEKLQALRIGVDDYLYKPFSPQELEARVNNVLSNYQKRKDFQTQKQESLQSVDQQWLSELETQTLELLKQNPNFLSNDVALKMLISEGHLRRKIRSITGLSANDYFTEIRLQRARHLLEQRAIKNVSKVAYTVGFNTPRYFTDLFVARFGKKPSSYLRDEPEESDERDELN